LKVVDSISCSRIHPNDTKRIIRALEVFENTGKPISELQKQRKGIAEIYDIKIFCLNTARQELYRRIEDRVEKMFKRGLVREVNSLLKSRLSKTASCAIGIKEIKGNLEGLCCLEEAKQMMKRNTRLYAKRQLTWFRKDKNIIWIEIYDKEKPGEIAKRIYELL
jgi:tRNA dimethylallyltransferase